MSGGFLTEEQRDSVRYLVWLRCVNGPLPFVHFEPLLLRHLQSQGLHGQYSAETIGQECGVWSPQIPHFVTPFPDAFFDELDDKITRKEITSEKDVMKFFRSTKRCWAGASAATNKFFSTYPQWSRTAVNLRPTVPGGIFSSMAADYGIQPPLVPPRTTMSPSLESSDLSRGVSERSVEQGEVHCDGDGVEDEASPQPLTKAQEQDVTPSLGAEEVVPHEKALPNDRTTNDDQRPQDLLPPAPVVASEGSCLQDIFQQVVESRFPQIVPLARHQEVTELVEKHHVMLAVYPRGKLTLFPPMPFRDDANGFEKLRDLAAAFCSSHPEDMVEAFRVCREYRCDSSEASTPSSAGPDPFLMMLLNQCYDFRHKTAAEIHRAGTDIAMLHHRDMSNLVISVSELHRRVCKCSSRNAERQGGYPTDSSPVVVSPQQPLQRHVDSAVQSPTSVDSPLAKAPAGSSGLDTALYFLAEKFAEASKEDRQKVYRSLGAMTAGLGNKRPRDDDVPIYDVDEDDVSDSQDSISSVGAPDSDDEDDLLAGQEEVDQPVAPDVDVASKASYTRPEDNAAVAEYLSEEDHEIQRLPGVFYRQLNVRGQRPDKKLGAVFAKEVVPRSLCEAAARILEPAATKHNRRAQTNGGVPPDTGIVGHYDYLGHPVKQKCRLTQFTRQNYAQIESGAVRAVLQLLDEKYREVAPQHYRLQRARIPEYHSLFETAFSTLTVNKAFRTAKHTDRGDFKDGLGVVCVLNGEWDGCHLAIPALGKAFDIRVGDVLFSRAWKHRGVVWPGLEPPRDRGVPAHRTVFTTVRIAPPLSTLWSQPGTILGSWNRQSSR